jgi:aspartyl-tRNA synthetase
MGELLGGWKRSQMCAEVGKGDIGKTVTVMGWAQRRRDLGNLIFVWLRDRTGIVQIVFDSSRNPELFDKAVSIRQEYVLAVRGEVTARTPENVNPQLKTGEVEVLAKELKILSEAETPPFTFDDDNVSEALRLKYRYLDLRRPEKQRVLMMKHAVTRSVREFLDGEGFIDLETPILTLSTPEGARDYLVPSRVFPGRFFALPQSPQLFKQLLMVSGFDRYYQIAKCFRDEDLRADRQPEFTQIDIEMSFVDEEDVYDVTERMFRKMFKDVLDVELPEHFPRLTYREAMARYGSDKPDTRFGVEIVDVGGLAAQSGFKVFRDTMEQGGSVRALCAPGAAASFSRKELDRLTEFVRTYKAKGLAYLMLEADGKVRSSFAKFLGEGEVEAFCQALGAKAGDALFFVADKPAVAAVALGQLRLEIGRKLGLIDESRFNFLWVTEFPMLEYDEEQGRYVAQHHPFCSPVDEDIPLMETHPEQVRAKAYDIVLNGTELASGSIRIHSNDLQQKVFRMLGFTPEQAQERFGFLLNAFQYGPPPHGGIAPGLDRIVMLMAGCDSIRDTIPFPKVQSSGCLMTEAPGVVDEKQLRELHLATTEPQNG